MLISQRPTLTEDVLAENRSQFVIEPLEPGFGYTLGNSLRRTLLSSIPGAAVTSIRIDGVLHEFTTNAAKYGALSEADGRIFIDWTIDREAGRTLKLVWRESGGPKVSEPSKKGFGNRLIERNIRHDLAGTISLDYAPDGRSRADAGRRVARRPDAARGQPAQGRDRRARCQRGAGQ